MNATTGRAASARTSPEDAPVLTIGHRGASGYAPEHTILSYDLALRLGADYIEQDLQMSSEGVLVALHDDTLDRTGGGSGRDCAGPVITKTLEQIETCDVGSWFNEAYPQYAQDEYVGLRICTLEEVFQRYGSGANYYIETKNPEAAPGMEEELLRLMDEYGLRGRAAFGWQVLIQSFSPASLRKIHALDPSLPLIRLYDEEGGEAIRASLDAARAYAVGVGPYKGDVDAQLVEEAHARCLHVHPYTVNEEHEMKALIELGVEGMFTDFPDRLVNALGKDPTDSKAAARRAAVASAACRARLSKAS